VGSNCCKEYCYTKAKRSSEFTNRSKNRDRRIWENSNKRTQAVLNFSHPWYVLYYSGASPECH